MSYVILCLLCMVWGAVIMWITMDTAKSRKKKTPKQSPFKPSYHTIIGIEMDVYGVTHYTEDGEYQKPYKAVLINYGPGGDHWTRLDTTWNPPSRDQWEEAQKELKRFKRIEKYEQRQYARGDF